MGHQRTQSVTTNKGTTTNGYRNAHLAQKLKLFIKCVKAQIRSFFRWRQTSNNLASAIFHHSKVPKELQVRAAARTLRKNQATQFNASNLRMLHKPYLEAISLVNKKLLPFCWVVHLLHRRKKSFWPTKDNLQGCHTILPLFWFIWYFLWVSNPLEWLFFMLVCQNLTQPSSLPGLGTGYAETTQERESLPVSIGGVFQSERESQVLAKKKIWVLKVEVGLWRS